MNNFLQISAQIETKYVSVYLKRKTNNTSSKLTDSRTASQKTALTMEPARLLIAYLYRNVVVQGSKLQTKRKHEIKGFYVETYIGLVARQKINGLTNQRNKCGSQYYNVLKTAYEI